MLLLQILTQKRNHTCSSTPKRQRRASLVEAFGARYLVSVCSADGACVCGDTWPQLGALLGNWAGDTGSLHFTLGVDDYTCVILEVEEVTLSSADRLALADDDRGHDLLSKLGFTLFDGRQEHVADGARRQTAESGTDAGAGNHIQVLSSGVVSAVHDGRHWQTVGDL